MTVKTAMLVLMVPKPSPPFGWDCDSRSPSKAPSGRVRM